MGELQCSSPATRKANREQSPRICFRGDNGRRRPTGTSLGQSHGARTSASCGPCKRWHCDLYDCRTWQLLPFQTRSGSPLCRADAARSGPNGRLLPCSSVARDCVIEGQQTEVRIRDRRGRPAPPAPPRPWRDSGTAPGPPPRGRRPGCTWPVARLPARSKPARSATRAGTPR